MKNTLTGLMLGIVLAVCVAGVARDRFYTTPSPQMSEAIVLLTMDEINALRGWTQSMTNAVAKASSLADLKIRVAELPAMPDRTTNQLVTALTTKLDAVPDYEVRTRNETFRVE